MMCRYISLEELEINDTIMTFGSLIFAIFRGLNLIYIFNSHKDDFLIQLLLQAWILQYMAGRILSMNLRISNQCYNVHLSPLIV